MLSLRSILAGSLDGFVNTIAMFLHALELAAQVRLGKEVEQWLSYEQKSDYEFIRWLSVIKIDDLFLVTYFESIDEGSLNFHDVYEFSALDPEDSPYGITNEFESLETAIAFAIEEYGAAADKFVAGGMIQKEYANHLRRNNKLS